MDGPTWYQYRCDNDHQWRGRAPAVGAAVCPTCGGAPVEAVLQPAEPGGAALVALLYILARDHVPWGLLVAEVESACVAAAADEQHYTGRELAQAVARLAGRILGTESYTPAPVDAADVAWAPSGGELDAEGVSAMMAPDREDCIELHARHMNRLYEVEWDRCYVDELGDGWAFGWVPHEHDGYWPNPKADFVLLVFTQADAAMWTSSARYSAEWGRRLHGEDAVHTDCQRVEHVYGSELVPKAIRLPPPPGEDVGTEYREA